MMKRTTFARFLLSCGCLLSSLPLCADDIVLTDADLTNAFSKRSYNRVSIHDPSIFLDTISTPNLPYFYVIGSHLGFSRKSKLQASSSWSNNLGGGESASCTLFANPSGTRVGFADAYSTQAVTTIRNYQGNEVPFPNFDAHAWQNSGFQVQGNQWAPDVVYNPTMGKWLMYMSVNGDSWCSSIVCLAASKPTGPWIYQGPVVMSGFQGTYAHNGYPAANDWQHTDLAIATGATSLPSRYAVGGNWGQYWPNCIDPCVFFDEQGELWMSYGSWSGGIWMLPLDKQTGLRDYTKQQPLQYHSGSDARNQKSDPYFGRKIAGGWYVSGEGSYIEHIGDYYFLFISYGFFAPDGGYEMRVFRSSNPDGPYVDCYGTSPLETRYRMNYGTTAATNYGMKLMGGYQWDFMANGELAQGHNSAITDKEGRSFVVYHTKFNNGTAWHEVRIHQLFLNQEGWPVAVPFEFQGETANQASVSSAESIANEEIPGDYELIFHKYNQNYAQMQIQSPTVIHLTANEGDPLNGKVSGGSIGTWSRIPGTDFIEVKFGTATYKGVLTRQTVDYSNIPTLCISALSSSSGSLTIGQNNFSYQRQMWASKPKAQAAIRYTLDNLSVPFTNGATVSTDLTLPKTGKLGASVSWSSTDETIITSAGKLGGFGGDVTLTAAITKDGYVYYKNYQLHVDGPSSLDVLGAEGGVKPVFDLTGRTPDETQQGIRIVGGKKQIIRK